MNKSDYIKCKIDVTLEGYMKMHMAVKWVLSLGQKKSQAILDNLR